MRDFVSVVCICWYISVIIVTIHEINCGIFASYTDNFEPSNSDFTETFIEVLYLLENYLKPNRPAFII